MRLIDAKNGAKRMRDNGMTFEFGRWRVSNALTQNIDHSLIVLAYKTD